MSRAQGGNPDTTYWNETRFDPVQKTFVPDGDAESVALGWARAFVNGVEDGSDRAADGTDDADEIATALISSDAASAK